MTIRQPGPATGLLFALATLAACADFGAPTTYAAMSSGVGFGDYQQHLRAREAARNSGVPFSIPPETARPAGMAAPERPGAPLPLPMAAQAGPVQSAPHDQSAPHETSGAMPGGQDTGGDARPVELADSTNFQPAPFGSRPEGAEIAPTGSTEIVHVTSVPQGGASGPNVLAYALQTTHSVGTQMYRRNNPLRWSRWERNCLQFSSQDLAQEAFLAAGGPERDPNHLDPDGDGFACWWDPEPLRRMARIAPAQQGGLSD